MLKVTKGPNYRIIDNCEGLKYYAKLDSLEFHREDGPAIIRDNGKGEEYWLNGKNCGSKENWIVELRKLKLDRLLQTDE